VSELPSRQNFKLKNEPPRGKPRGIRRDAIGRLSDPFLGS